MSTILVWQALRDFATDMAGVENVEEMVGTREAEAAAVATEFGGTVATESGGAATTGDETVATADDETAATGGVCSVSRLWKDCMLATWAAMSELVDLLLTPSPSPEGAERPQSPANPWHRFKR